MKSRRNSRWPAVRAVGAPGKARLAAPELVRAASVHQHAQLIPNVVIKKTIRRVGLRGFIVVRVRQILRARPPSGCAKSFLERLHVTGPPCARRFGSY